MINLRYRLIILLNKQTRYRKIINVSTHGFWLRRIFMIWKYEKVGSTLLRERD